MATEHNTLKLKLKASHNFELHDQSKLSILK